MTNKEFNLSDKIEESPSSQAKILYLPSVKQAIKLLKDFTRADRWTVLEMLQEIDKIFGDKLTK